MTVAFLTLFLGLTVGVHPVTVTVAPEVERVRVLLDGEPVGVAEAETGWTVPVDFGEALSPRELTAVAYAARGEELGRTRQAINLARPPAEAEVVIEGGGSGEGVVARLSWESVKPSEPRSVTAVFDGRPLPVDDPRRIELPSHDPTAVHFLRVRIEFSDSVAATVEATFGGTYGDRTQTELTAVLVAVQEDGDVLSPQHLEGRLATAEGAPVKVVAVEKGPAEVAFVLGREAKPALWELARKQILFWASRYPDRNRRFRRALQHRDESGVERPNTSFWRSEMELNADQSLYLLWPYAEPVNRSGPSFELFPRSQAHPPDDGGVFWILSEADPPEAPPTEARLADAAAVAGMTATARSRRRAVVLVVSPDPEDASRFEPGAVRRYLAELGVPFEVWVIGRPGRSVRRRWGDAVRGVPSVDAFGHAVEDLARRLDRQRIVWVEGPHLPQEIVVTGWVQTAEGEEAPEPGPGAPEAPAEPAPTPAPALELERFGTHRLGDPDRVTHTRRAPSTPRSRRRRRTSPRARRPRCARRPSA